jgi:hypothetical protein
MINKTHLSTILLFAAVIWGILLVVISGVPVSFSWLKHLSTVTGILLLLLGAFDLWLWRLPIWQGWFVKRPILCGTWRVVLRSGWLDPPTGKNIEQIEGFAAIRQTYSSLSIRLFTSESTSELIGAEFNKSLDGTIRIAGVYRNEPKLSLRQRSPIHYGAILLDVTGKPIKRLVGHYWTDRSTSGEIELNTHHSEIFHDYKSAKDYFGSMSA